VAAARPWHARPHPRGGVRRCSAPTRPPARSAAS
jgi:hypothetical protein